MKLLIFLAFLAYASFTLGNACTEVLKTCLQAQAETLNQF